MSRIDLQAGTLYAGLETSYEHNENKNSVGFT